MNTVNLAQLLDNYYEKYAFLNSGGRDEYFKLKAVQCFKNQWDSEATDFVQMFKEAIKESANLIDGSAMHPTSGIIALAQRPELTGTIKEAFAGLFADDGGDIDKRQDKIENFNEIINKLLDEYEPGKWSFRQDFRTALCFVNLISPDDNYFYKATQSRAFMDCVEHPDFGYGKDFSLKKYYKMCDWLVSQIEERPGLIEAQKEMIKESKGSMYPDLKHHILAFDIIYCAVTYNLYSGINIVKIPAKQKKYLDLINELRDTLARQTIGLNELLADRAQYDEISLEGLPVVSKAFGPGFIVSQHDNLFTAKFGDVEKKFVMPQSFASGVLKTDDEIMQFITKMIELDNRITTQKSDILQTKLELKKYVVDK